MSAKEARENFSDLLGMVYYGKEPIIVERKGKPMAVLISPEQFERYEGKVMERFGQVLDELHDRTPAPTRLRSNETSTRPARRFIASSSAASSRSRLVRATVDTGDHVRREP